MTAHCNPVDIPGMFPDFSKDPKDPASYDFAFADVLVNGLVDAGVEPFRRLGVTFENYTAIKGYHVFPPKNPQKWAEICEGVIRHYTEGWADGYHFNITFWEIWNEPDNYETYPDNNGWAGTKEEYYELYDITAKHLKKCFPHLKIGGYSSCGFYALTEAKHNSGNCSPRHEYFIEFFDGFIDYIGKSGAPLDFFSWHSYPDSIEDLRTYARAAANGRHGAIMISNPSDADIDLELDFDGDIYECKIIDESCNLSPIGCEKPKRIASGTVLVITVDIYTYNKKPSSAHLLKMVCAELGFLIQSVIISHFAFLSLSIISPHEGSLMYPEAGFFMLRTGEVRVASTELFSNAKSASVISQFISFSPRQ